MSDHGAPYEGQGKPFDDEIPFAALFNMGLGLLALVVVSALAVWGLYFAFLDWEEAADPAPPVLEEASTRTEPPGPKLLAQPEGELARHRQAEQQRIDGYEWADREAGTVRIPVDRAIEVLAERGLDPGPEADAATADEPTPDGDEEDSSTP